MAVGYQVRRPGEALRVLFCLGVTQNWFDSDRAARGDVVEALKRAFDNLETRFGVKVLATFDDDELMVGQSLSWPWTGYIVAEAPDIESVIAICNLVRDTEVGPVQLWKYLRIEARVGSPLFFGNH